MSFDPLLHLRGMAVRLECTPIAYIVLDDPRFAYWSGSSKPNQHHYGKGGLARHTAEVAILCKQVAENLEQIYPVPSECEMYLAALFHDYGKIWDYSKDEHPMATGATEAWITWSSTPHKRLIHHISRSAIEWSRAVDKHPAYKDIEESVLHAILAHHGQREWGSPVAPKTRLAWLLHLCDGLSARFNDADSCDVLDK